MRSRTLSSHLKKRTYSIAIMTKQKIDKCDLTEKNESTINKEKKTTIIDSDEPGRRRKKPDFFIANPVKFFTTKELCHYKNIDKFFRDCYIKNPDILTCMMDIIESRSKISLRILDWFVTKYSKKKIPYGINKNTEFFDVRISYDAQLKGYKKRNFDPFRRRENFYYPCNEEGYKLENGESKHVLTTLGQLNFFKWAFNNNIIAYVEDNLDQIVTEMNNFTKDEKKKKLKEKEDEKEDKKEEKRKSQIKDETSEKIKVNVVKTKEKNEVKLVITFD
jgi:hypothetical protein